MVWYFGVTIRKKLHFTIMNNNNQISTLPILCKINNGIDFWCLSSAFESFGRISTSETCVIFVVCPSLSNFFHIQIGMNYKLENWYIVRKYDERTHKTSDTDSPDPPWKNFLLPDISRIVWPKESWIKLNKKHQWNKI